MIAAFGLIVGGIVYRLGESILLEEHNRRTALVTAALADGVSGYLASRDMLQLKTLVAKYARLSGVAYVFIEDGEGKVIAESLLQFPVGLQQSLTLDQRRQAGSRVVTLNGKSVYEARGPILEGQLGTAHLGIWADDVSQEVYQDLVLLLGAIALVLIAALIVAVLLTRRLIRPFRRLTEIADRISIGDLDTPVRVESRHEFGELTRSLERMRASLKAAQVRLGQPSPVK
ncbi:MAG: HAMP domain-containing protein [Candidatus Binatia bacterium]